MFSLKNNKLKLTSLLVLPFLINGVGAYQNDIPTEGEAWVNAGTNYTIYLNSSGISAEKKLYQLCRYSAWLANVIDGTEKKDYSNNLNYFLTLAEEIVRNYQSIHKPFLKYFKRKDLEFIRDRALARSVLLGDPVETNLLYLYGYKSEFRIKLTSQEAFVLSKRTSDGIFDYRLPSDKNSIVIYSNNYLGERVKSLDLNIGAFILHESGRTCFLLLNNFLYQKIF